MTHDNYLHRRNQFMRSFDRLLARVKPSVSSWLGEEQAEKFMRELRQEYEALIPRIPFIGNSFVTLSFYKPVTRYLAVYRALQKQGRTVEEAGRLIYRMGTEEALAIPPLGRRVHGSSLVFPVAQEVGQEKGNQVTATHIPGQLCDELRGRRRPGVRLWGRLHRMCQLQIPSGRERLRNCPVCVRNRQTHQRIDGLGLVPDNNHRGWIPDM